MSRIQSYRDLDAWKTRMDLVVAVYPVSARLPDSERFDLRRQINRAAASIPANVAEGQGNGPLQAVSESRSDRSRFAR